MPKISVIVPVYNTEQYLPRCIDSILSQTFTDFELLLIDDGSTDSSGTICDEYAQKDSRVRVFHKENGGVSSARNHGLDNAVGEWITFVDSDDYILSNFTETLVRLCEKNVDLCICGIKPDYSFSTDYKITCASLDYCGDIKGVLSILNECQMSGSLCNKLFKSSIIRGNTLLLNEGYRFREDEDFLLRYMCHAQKVASSSETCYVYLIPDFQKKYSHVDNFPVSLSLYSSILQIYDNEINNTVESYLTDLICSFFESFKHKGINHWERTRSIKRIIDKRILNFRELSRTSRFILYYLPSFLVTPLFVAKARYFY